MARILVIDDEDMICQLAARILRLGGHDVVTAADPRQGVEFFRRQPFDVVITDVRMPGLTGPDVIKILHSVRTDTRVIVMGGDGSVPAFGTEAFARQVGADSVLLKPFGVQELIAAVSALLAPAAGG